MAKRLAMTALLLNDEQAVPGSCQAGPGSWAAPWSCHLPCQHRLLCPCALTHPLGHTCAPTYITWMLAALKWPVDQVWQSRFPKHCEMHYCYHAREQLSRSSDFQQLLSGKSCCIASAREHSTLQALLTFLHQGMQSSREASKQAHDGNARFEL